MGGEVDGETGMVVNLATLDEVVQTSVLDRFDHANLNLDPLFVNQVPTTENLTESRFRCSERRAASREAGVCARGRDREQFLSSIAGSEQ